MGIKSLGNKGPIKYKAVWDQTAKGAASGVPIPLSASGGTKTIIGDYTYHQFSPADPGNFVIAHGDTTTIDCVLIGGGGGGGWGRAGGGGAGAFYPLPPFNSKVGTHPVSTGAGGAGRTVPGPGGSVGGDTVFVFDGTPYTANGGGFGTSDDSNASGCPSPGNGSGGGSEVGGSQGGSGGAYGFPGMRSMGPAGGSYEGGGGGGAGGVAGPSVNAGPTGYEGGPGKTLPWIPTAYGVNGYFAGGGCGGGNGVPNGSHPFSAPGGGGRGGVASGSPNPTMAATDGVAKTGSGGGGGANTGNKNGGSGGTGSILLRYKSI